MQRSPGRRVPPVTIRSRMVLELASELITTEGWPFLRAHIELRERDFDPSGFGLFGSGSPDGINLVATRQVSLAMLNPSCVLTMAYHGMGPFQQPVRVRVITVIPDYDQITLAVAHRTGLQSFAEIATAHYPLRVSVRGPKENSVPIVANEMCKAYGFTLDDVESWGGRVSYDRRLPGQRVEDVARGETDAIFDEAVVLWAERAADLGMRFLEVDDEAVGKLRRVGLRRGVIERADYPRLPSDVPTVDFSGFPVYTHAQVPDEQVTAICKALEARRATIPWEGGDGPLPLDRMCSDTREGPLDVPLHPAAEAFWRKQGYLT